MMAWIQSDPSQVTWAMGGTAVASPARRNLELDWTMPATSRSSVYRMKRCIDARSSCSPSVVTMTRGLDAAPASPPAAAPICRWSVAVVPTAIIPQTPIARIALLMAAAILRRLPRFEQDHLAGCVDGHASEDRE